ncbi:hypothetical protein [Desulfohalovibrio reitneri]|uniref:hypothetical protein n=1 Tax=Desulfohalovibrio reitneri TaxID=1307759 RepID=UPI0004A6F321|nr:hypothetical protein [Desulfohalovibrio reitneri]
MSGSDKVHSITDYKDENPDGEANLANEVAGRTSRDMAKVSIFISILAVLLLVVFFFGLNQNIRGLTSEVEALSGLEQEVGQLSGSVEGLEQRVDNMPQQMRQAMVVDALNEMNARLGQIGEGLNETQAARLNEAMQLMQQVQADLE